MTSKNILLLDGYNLLYRARSGFTRGDNPIVFNFFRSFRALVEKFDPDKVYFVLEGAPKKRSEMFEGYKAQRTYHDKDNFQSQKKTIIRLLKSYFPIEVVRHPDYECDDIIAGLATQKHASDNCVIVSSDTDFLQVYESEEHNTKVYNPVKKKFVTPPCENYLKFKALTGDSSDNIPGFKGIGQKRALKMSEDLDLFEDFMSKDDNRDRYNKNYSLIKFHDVSDALGHLEVSHPGLDWDTVKSTFQNFEFTSIVNDKSWKKFVTTFENLGS